MNASTTATLLFNWEAPRGRNLAITGFLIASLAAHAAGFYLFQVVYPPTVSLTPPPQRVNLISANSEQGATLLRWIDAEDPALASTTRKPPDARRYLLGKVQHIPSYFAREPTLQEAPPLTVNLRVPSAQPPGPVPAPLRARPGPIGVAPTRVIFSSELDRLGRAGLSAGGLALLADPDRDDVAVMAGERAACIHPALAGVGRPSGAAARRRRPPARARFLSILSNIL